MFFYNRRTFETQSIRHRFIETEFINSCKLSSDLDKFEIEIKYNLFSIMLSKNINNIKLFKIISNNKLLCDLFISNLSKETIQTKNPQLAFIHININNNIDFF